MFLVNSRFPLVSAAHTRSRTLGSFTRQAPLLPKLRGHFAEFLNHDSLDRLSILYLITCVGLGYGRLKPRVDAFLGSIGSPNHPPKGAPIRSQTYMNRGFAYDSSYTLGPGQFHCLARLPSCVTPVNTLTSLARVPRRTPNNIPEGTSKGSLGWLALPVQYGRFFAGTGISTRCPSTTPVGLALGPDLPRAD